jgi:multidrug resistance efflux pump
VSSDADILSAQANLATANADLRQLEESYQDILDTCFDTPDGEVCPLYGPIEENTREQLEVARLYQIAAQETLNALIAGATPGQVAAAGGSVSVAIARRDLAQAELALLLAGPTDEQIVLAELAVEQATIGVEIAQAAVLQASAAVLQADVAVDLSETAVSQAQNTLDRFTLRAAKSGTVAQINANIGELVGVGVPVLTIADFSSWVIKTDNLTELNIPFINEGAPATISLDALGGEEISGTVTTIGLIATSYQGDVVYEVTISLQDTAELPLRWGMTGFVEIETSS